MPQHLCGKKLILKQGDLQTRVRGDFTAMVWQDRRDPIEEGGMVPFSQPIHLQTADTF